MFMGNWRTKHFNDIKIYSRGQIEKELKYFVSNTYQNISIKG